MQVRGCKSCPRCVSEICIRKDQWDQQPGADTNISNSPQVCGGEIAIAVLLDDLEL